MSQPDVEDIYALSPMQRGMLYHTLRDPSSGVYFQQVCFALEGRVDAKAMEAAWSRVVERHPILRTAFVWEGLDEPVQVVHRRVGLPFASLDWTDATPQESERRLDALLAEDRRQGFDPARAPLMRVTLAKTAPDRHHLLWSFHHALLDGWSTPLVLREVFQTHHALARGDAPDLPRARPFRDHIAWIAAQDLKACERHWRAALAGFRAPTPAPFVRPPGPEGAGDAGLAVEDLDEATTAALQALARRHRVTLGTLVQGAWGLLLARYGGEDDVVFGATVSGRPADLEGVESMVGLFINTLPVRVRAPDEARLDAWVKDLQARAVEARQHEYSPLVQVQAWSDVPRGTPLFSSILVFENYPVEAAAEGAEGALRVQARPIAEKTNYPLTVVAIPYKRLSLRVAYDRARLDPEDARRIAASLRALLASMATAPADAKLGDLRMLRPEERAALVADAPAAGTAAAPPLVHESFEAQARRAPTRVAVTCGAESLTYAELDARANRLAHRLRALGVAPGALVGLCMERSVDLVAAVLGILKAGAAYVPVDPAYPQDRIAFTLADAAVAAVVTQSALAPRLAGDAPRVLLDLADALEGMPETPLASGATADSLAYVIYTSGSTGMPKGVLVHHGAVARLFSATDAWFGFGPDDAWTLFHSISFDFSVWELWGALAYGGRLVVVPQDVARNPEAFHQLLRDERVTVLNQTPSAFRALSRADEAAPAGALALRHVVFGGEALETASLKPWFDRHGDETPRLVNMYGITETTVHVTYRPIGREDALRGDVSPIGVPIPDLTLDVVDRRGEPAPVGVAGELVVGGAGVALGYLNRPGLTAERFVADPFRPGRRVYRSGDLARRLPGGDIEYLGRIDQQIKIRGFRIEPGEIEAALVRHPQVREAVVIAREDSPGDKRIVAYVVPRGAAPTTSELRDHLRQGLPDHMVPAAFVPLDAIPLTTNGKVDRKALPAPEAERLALGIGHVAPRTPTEEGLCAIWARVLRVERVGVTDDLFALGGDSLLATQIVSRAREAFGVEIPLKAVFSPPTVEGLARAVDALRAARGDLSGPIETLAPTEDPVPLTPAQEGMVFHAAAEPGKGLYLQQADVVVDGPLDAARVEAALLRVAERHPTLRAALSDAEGSPRLVVHRRPAPPELQTFDLRGMPQADQDARVALHLASDRARGFDAARPPLSRMALFRLAERTHRLVWSHHHAVADATSATLILREILQAAAGQPLGPPPQASYGRHARAPRDDAAAEAHWRASLAGLRAATPLVVDRPGAGRGEGRDAHVELAPEATAALRALARRAHAPLAAVVEGAWGLLLARYNREEDVVFGIALEPRYEQDDSLGCRVCVVPLRLHAGAGTVESFVRDVATRRAGALAHAATPLTLLHAWTDVPRGEPLLTSVVSVEPTPLADALATPSLTVRSARVHERSSYPATLRAECGERLGLRLAYDDARMEDAGARRMLAHLATLLEGMARDPGAPVGRLELATPEERARILRDWNATRVPYPAGLVASDLFEAQARRTPDAVAVTFEGASLTYAQLDARTNQLARRLRALGVGPDTLVGICAERSIEMVVAIHGVLKAGGAYVPLDPTYPRDRLAYMIEDAAAPVVLVQAHLADRVPAGASVVRLDADWHDVARESPAPLPRLARPDSLAYVIYTSGSTGRPKGVCVPHEGIVNRILWMQDEYGLDASDVVLQKTPYSFDVSVWEFLWPLATGARLHVLRPEGHKDPDHLVDVLAREGITTLHFVPSMLAAFLEAAGHERCRALARVFCSGEALPYELTEGFFAKMPWSQLHNLYGPTEASVDVSYWACVPDSPDRSVPIGRPVANTTLYVLDPNGLLCPAGVPGELHIGGIQLARGYLNKPELTAERFVPDPFSDAPGARLYRTGDLARFRDEGAIDYLGRLDNQVKIRGFRIELGEIEAALLEHPALREAAVTAWDPGTGEKRLVAYLVHRGEMPAAEDLRAHLRRSLPDHMVPATFVPLARMPLTPSGKTDRKALPSPEAERPRLAQAYIEPRTPDEVVLAGIWTRILGVDKAGVRDDFLALGGDSLRATRLVSAARAAFNVAIDLPAILGAPTIEQQAAVVAAARARGPANEGQSIVPVARRGHLPLSFAQQRLWFLHQLDPESPGYNIPVAARLSGKLDVSALERAFSEIVRRHESLRTTYDVAEDGQPVQLVQPAEPVVVGVVDLTGLPPEEREPRARQIAGEHARAPFDLARGPVVRFKLLRFAPEEHVLLQCFHHIAFDGWSAGTFARELTTLYGAFVAGRPSPLPEPRLQYGDFAAWQRRVLEGKALDDQLAYWTKQLTGLAPLDLPTDRPRPPVQSFRGDIKPFLIGRDVTARVRALCRAEGTTLFMPLLAAFQAFLSRYTGQEDVAVGSLIAGRNRAETEDLVGFFVNTQVLRTDLSGSPSFRALLARVRETCFGAYAHQDLPFEMLVETIQPERDLSRTPLFQVMFGLQNTGDDTLDLAGVKLSSFGPTLVGTKFDLNVQVVERGDELVVLAGYNTDIFDVATVDRMMSHFTRLLAGAVADPDRPVATVPMLADEERRALVHGWNDTRADYPQRPVHELFAEAARRAPDAPAIAFRGAEWTYAEVDARANRLAHRLRAMGVGPDGRVALALPRGDDLLVAMLATLKAGGAYVPLDPALPRERFAAILDDTGALALVTHERIAPDLPPHPRTIRLDAEPGLALERDDAPPPAATLDHLAYVIYTSGSTGKPKGVMVTHRGVTNYSWHIARSGLLDGGRGSLVHSSLAFDLAITGLWPVFVAGGCVRLAAEDDGPSALPEAFASEHDLSFVKLTPSHLNLLAHEVAPSDVPGRTRAFVCGGEALSGDDLAFWMRADPALRVMNHYGPTETTVGCATTWVSAEDVAGGAIPIGRPIANTQLHVLDAHRNPVPVNVPGELYIGGHGLARGYLGQPALTAERFVPDPFSPEPGARLYRTGDLVKRAPDGRIVYLGRIDQQVKIRGFRIELGEIEGALLAHPALRDATVIAREDPGGPKRLVAYVVAAPDHAAPPASELRDHLKRTLPEYMLPAAFVALDAIPLNANGKVDRKALPAPEAPADAGSAYVAPRNAAEAALAEVWAEVLRAGRVGIHDNFFGLGGDSILSIQVVSRAARKGLRVTPKQLFQHQTVAELAAVATTAAPARAQQGPVTGPVALTPIQRAFFARDLPDRHHYNQSVLFALPEAVDERALRLALGDVVAHHDMLRARYRQADGEWRQDVAAPHEAALDEIDLSSTDDAGLRDAVRDACDRVQASLDLARGPIARFALLDLGRGRGKRLLVVVHHLAMDGVSWRVLPEDVESAYARRARGQPPALPPKTTSFQAWADRLAAYARSPAAREELPRWLALSKLALDPLPRDGPGGANDVASEAHVVHTLPEDVTQALLTEVAKAYRAGPEDAILAAVALAARATFGRERVLVKLEGHGREDLFDDVDVSRTVGWFTTHHPVLLDAGDARDLGALLKTVKEAVRAAPHRGLGFGVLRWSGDDETRDALARVPQPEVSVNYLGQFDGGAAAPDAPRLLGPAPEPRGRDDAPTGTRASVLHVNGAVGPGGRLSLVLTYSRNLHREATVKGFAQRVAQALGDIARHCGDPAHGGCTPSDFPLAGLDAPRLDTLLAGRARDVANVLPLTPMQEGMLYETLVDPGSGVYVQQGAFLLQGPCDADAMEKAWRLVIARHAALRTSFHWKGLPRPVQVVHRSAPLALDRRDWSREGPDEARRLLDALLADDRARGHALDAAPLMRLSLVRVSVDASASDSRSQGVGADDAHWLVWSNHHLILDGWSAPLVLQEALSAHDALRAGREPSLPPARPFSDYVAWLARRDRTAAEAHWRAALAGFRAPTPLSFGRTPDAAPPGPPGVVETTLSEAASALLAATARRLQVTVNTVVQGAWAAVLAHASGEDDVVFGATVSGRPPDLPGVESMVGMFINTLPVRVPIPREAPASTWLSQLQARQAETLQHEATPLVDIQGWSEVPRGTPLFESLLVFENAPGAESAPADAPPGRLAVRGTIASEKTSFPLALLAAPGKRLFLRVSYDPRRFDAAAAQGAIQRLARAIERIARDPETPVGALARLPDAERAQLAALGQGPDLHVPDETVHALVAAQAARTPGALAVQHGDATLTYAELVARADALAARLRAAGVARGDLVGVCVERSLDLPVAVLGVLQAGAAYVPLDPAYPQDRIAYMLEDSGARVVATQAGLAARLGGATAVLVDGDGPRVSLGSVDAAKPDDLAYVIYTSGSTGKPKGTQVTHRNLVSFLLSMRDTLGLRADDRMLSLTTLSFDIAGLELYAPLLVGARVVIAPREAQSDPRLLAGLLEEATHCQATPVTWRMLLDAGWAGSPRLTALCGGEAMPLPLARALAPRTARLWNLYGPTETTVWSAAWPVPREPERVSIGRPIHNTRVTIVDLHGEPAPVAVPGELLIGGEGVARGYLNRPDLTAERFVERDGTRWYRTGDLARWSADGTLECLGRIDSQVKLRGHRVELGEVEAALAACPGVAQAAAAIRTGPAGEPMLVGYLVASPGAQAPDAAELRRRVARFLPDAMIPGAFLTLDAMPLTPNGKVDRKALPAPGADHAARPFVEPRDDAEAAVAAIWQSVLGLPRVGALDHFFEAGGHSLHATQVVSRLQDAFGVEVPLRAVFDAPTVETLARLVVERLEAALKDEIEGMSDDEAARALAGRGSG